MVCVCLAWLAAWGVGTGVGLCVSPLEACEVTDVPSLAVAPEAAWAALLMSLMHMHRQSDFGFLQFPFSRTLSPISSSPLIQAIHFVLPRTHTLLSVSVQIVHLCSLLHFSRVSPGDLILLKCAHRICCFFFFCQTLALAGGSLFKCWQSERFSKEHDQMKEGESLEPTQTKD